MSQPKKRVAVVFGGRSSEHAISCVTAGSVLQAIDRTAYDVVPIGIATDGRWVLESGDPETLQITGPDKLPEVDGARAAVTLARDAHATDLVVHEPSQPPQTLGEVDVVFPVLHGPFGEDGTIQAMLDAAGLAYTGSGVAASALGMDKALFKRMCRGIGLPVVDWIEVRTERWAAARDAVLAELEAFAAGSGDPRLMIKPARLGSSVGMTLAHDAAERAAGLDVAFGYDTLALVELYLPGARDLEVSVIGNDPARLELYGPGEIISGHEFYDYDAKYTAGLSETSVSS